MLLPLRLLLFILFLYPSARAAEIVDQYLSVKALGMGNAMMAHAQGQDAVFYNPAGLSSLSGIHLRALGIGVGLNGYDVYKDYADLVDAADQDLASALNSIYGRPIFGRMDLVTSLSLGNVIFGAYGTGNAGFTLYNPAYPYLNSAYFADYGFFLGWGHEIIPKLLDFGFVGRQVTRYGGDVDIGPATIAGLESSQLEDELTRKGTALAFDFGVKLKIPTEWNPSLNFMWKDVGKTKFNIRADNPPPNTIQDQINVGVGFERDFGIFTFRPAADYRGLNSGGEDFGKKMHVGVELGFPVVSVRGGFNQGYYTAGLTFDLWLFEVDIATYGVELGEYAGQDEDRRYIVQLSMDLGYSPSEGGFYSQSKSRARSRSRSSGLKQRR